MITYNLKDGQNSNLFYQKVSVVTDDVIAKGKMWLQPDLSSFISDLKKQGQFRSYEEHLFDFLLLGVLWNSYSNRAVKLNSAISSIMLSLFNLRQKRRNIKPYVDKVRGVLFTVFMDDEKSDVDMPAHNMQNLYSLIKWLKASGEFKEEVKRLENLFSFLGLKSEDEADDLIYKLTLFAEWFKKKSYKELNRFTSGVNNFIDNNIENYKFREDLIFVSRPEVEYHLNMVGSELMNRVFKDNFRNTAKKVLLLPACMRIHNNDFCKAIKNDLDLICTGCNKKCNVHKYTSMGVSDGYEVRIIPHSSDFSAWVNKVAGGKNIGVIGVACILNLIQGGLELKELNIPAQCVFLDYCGCKNHWHSTGIPTDINPEKLSSILCN